MTSGGRGERKGSNDEGGPRTKQTPRKVSTGPRPGPSGNKPSISGRKKQTATKSPARRGGKGSRGGGRGRGGGRSEKQLTQQELDAELDSYLLKDPETAKITLDDELENYMAKTAEAGLPKEPEAEAVAP